MEEKNSLTPEEKLRELIRIPTVCRSEQYEIGRYREKLKELFPEVFRRAEAAEVGEALLLKLAGSRKDLLPVLFTGHMDVVAASPEGWTYPPFSGEIENGRIWGRGSLDMKGAQCALFGALDALLKNGWKPGRDLWLYLSCDEEIGGPTAAKAAALLKERGVRLETVFDEGGTLGENFWGKVPGLCALVAVAEKGTLEYRFTARAPGGHAANPPKNSAIVRLCRLVTELEDNSGTVFRRGLSPEMKDLLRETARHFDREDRKMLEEALTDEEPGCPALFRVLPEQANFLLGATIAFTVMKGGTAFNVMPKEAVLTANVRPTVEQKAEEITRILKEKAAEYQVECELVGGGDASPFSDRNSPGYRAVEAAAEKLLGAIPVIPFILVGGTDSKHFLSVAGNAIRFSPIFIGEGQGTGVHGINEYITVKSLRDAQKFYEIMLSDSFSEKDGKNG